MDPWGGMDPQIVELKAWKNARKMGKISIKAADIQGPTDDIRAREFDPAHCAVLKRKLQTTGSSNSKGVKLVVISEELEHAWLTASKQEQLAMFTDGAQFYGEVMSMVKYAVGGDHTRFAVTELNLEYPDYVKWKLFKKLTILVTGTTPDAYQMCKDLGVMYNSKQYHKEMGFADRLLLTHKYFEQKGQLEKGQRRTPEVTAWCDKQCALAHIPVNSWSQYAAAARLEGNAWLYMEAILKGKYGLAIKRGHLPAVIPTSQSPMIKILTCPSDVVEKTLASVYNGTLSISMLNNEAENYKAYAMTKEMITWAVAMESSQACNERVVAKAYPTLMSRGFILEFVPGIKSLMKSAKNLEAQDCPPWIKVKVVEHLRYKQQVCATIRTSMINVFCSCPSQAICAKKWRKTPFASRLAKRRTPKWRSSVRCFLETTVLSLGCCLGKTVKLVFSNYFLLIF